MAVNLIDSSDIKVTQEDSDIKLDFTPNAVANKNEYSTTEIRIGTWLNKPLYRKVINFGALPNSSTKTVTTGLSNVVYVRYYGYATDGTYYWNLNVPRPISGNAYGIGCYISNNSIVMECGTDKSSNSAYVVVEYTKNSD